MAKPTGSNLQDMDFAGRNGFGRKTEKVDSVRKLYSSTGVRRVSNIDKEKRQSRVKCAGAGKYRWIIA